MATKGLTVEHITERLLYLTVCKGKDGHPDHTAQARALELALKIRGNFAPTKITTEDNRDEVEVHAAFVALLKETLPEIVQKLAPPRVIEIENDASEKSTTAFTTAQTKKGLQQKL